jgi:hypothetical protein
MNSNIVLFFSDCLPSLPLFRVCELKTFLHATAYLIRVEKKIVIFVCYFYTWKIPNAYSCSALMTATEVALLLLLLLLLLLVVVV